MSFPKELQALPQWVSWRTETRGDKKTKVLLRADGSYAKSNDSETWDSFQNVKKRKHEGIGFVFVKGVVGIDLDNAFYVEGENKGQLKKWAKIVLEHFDTYTEYSPSFLDEEKTIPKGLHIIGKTNASFDGLKYNLEPEERVEKNKEEGIECYTWGRFFTVTERVYEKRDTLKQIDDKKLIDWVQHLRDKRNPKPIRSPFTEMLPSDEEILRRIRGSRNGAKFQALYDQGDWQGLGFGSQSEADLSLAGSLMFFCRNNYMTADRLFRLSRLFREKWNEKHGNRTYAQMTLEKAYRAQVCNWLDPSSDDPEDILREIRLFGDIQIEKTDIGFVAKSPVKNGAVHFTFTEVSVSRQSIDAVVEIQIFPNDDRPSSPYGHRIDIRSSAAQTTLTTGLNKAFGDSKKGGYNWSLIANNVFNALGKRISAEQKVVKVLGRNYEEPKFLLYPFLQEKATNMFFAQPETSKSWLALHIAASLASGVPTLGFSAEKGHKTIYVDYEDSEQVFASRLHRICAGLGLPFNEVANNIGYIQLMGSVKDNIEILRRNVSEGGYSLVVFDAGGDACGGSPNDEQKVIEFFNAIQSLDCTRLVLHHEPKSTTGVSDENSYYGTMYWRGRSRIAWRLVKESEENGDKLVKMVLSKKSNIESMPAIYYKLSIEPLAMAKLLGRDIPEARITVAETPEEGEEEKKGILDAIGSDGASKEQIMGMTGMPKSTAIYMLGKLKNEQKVFSKKIGRNVTWYRNNG